MAGFPSYSGLGWVVSFVITALMFFMVAFFMTVIWGFMPFGLVMLFFVCLAFHFWFGRYLEG